MVLARGFVAEAGFCFPAVGSQNHRTKEAKGGETGNDGTGRHSIGGHPGPWARWKGGHLGAKGVLWTSSGLVVDYSISSI